MFLLRYFLWGFREIDERFSVCKVIEILIMAVLAGLLLIVPHLKNVS
jgi:hypothetical protein